MQFRQPFQARTDIVKLVNFVEDSLKSHGCALFIRAKWKRTSDGLLSSEDLKEEKVVTTPPISIRDIAPPVRAYFAPLGQRDHLQMDVKERTVTQSLLGFFGLRSQSSLTRARSR